MIFVVKQILLNKNNSEDNFMRQREVYVEEVELTLSQCSLDKVPRPDRIDAGALKFLWSTIHVDMLKTIHLFMDNGNVSKGLLIHYLNSRASNVY